MAKPIFARQGSGRGSAALGLSISLNIVKDRVRNRFNVSIAEVDDLDLWQRATLGVACVSKDRTVVERTLAHVATFVEGLNLASVEDVSVEIL